MRVVSFLFLFLLGDFLLSYVVILKDGSKIIATKPIEKKGNKVIVTLTTGQITALKESEVDFEATRKANESSYGDAIVIGDTKVISTKQPPVQKQPSLGEIIRKGVLQKTPILSERAKPRDTEGLPKTPGGYPNLMLFAPEPVGDEDIENLVKTVFSKINLEATIGKGTIDGRLFLRVITNNSRDVFKSLRAASFLLLKLREKGKNVEALEIIMVNERRERAGQFLINVDRARELLDEKVSSREFFVRYVEF